MGHLLQGVILLAYETSRSTLREHTDVSENEVNMSLTGLAVGENWKTAKAYLDPGVAIVCLYDLVGDHLQQAKNVSLRHKLSASAELQVSCTVTVQIALVICHLVICQF